jgi:hypothetical protein
MMGNDFLPFSIPLGISKNSLSLFAVAKLWRKESRDRE